MQTCESVLEAVHRLKTFFKNQIKEVQVIAIMGRIEIVILFLKEYLLPSETKQNVTDEIDR